MAELRKHLSSGHLVKLASGHLAISSTGKANPHDVTITIAGSCADPWGYCQDIDTIVEMEHWQLGGAYCFWYGVDPLLLYTLDIFQYSDGTIKAQLSKPGWAILYENADVSSDVTITCNEIAGTFDLAGTVGHDCEGCTATVTVAPQ